MEFNRTLGAWSNHRCDPPGSGFGPRHRQGLDMPVVGGDLGPYRLRGFEAVKIPAGEINQYATRSCGKMGCALGRGRIATAGSDHFAAWRPLAHLREG